MDIINSIKYKFMYSFLTSYSQLWLVLLELLLSCVRY
jgi:hypothetical protein